MKAVKRFKASVCVVTIAAMMAIMPSKEASAGLKEALNDMFVTTSTSPQAYNSQRLMGVYGGSMSLRAPGKGINIVQFAPPRIDAGCGGIDIFFGSFSFINGECLANFTKSAVWNKYIKSLIDSLSLISCSLSIISDEVISIALKPNRSSI